MFNVSEMKIFQPCLSKQSYSNSNWLKSKGEQGLKDMKLEDTYLNQPKRYSQSCKNETTTENTMLLEGMGIGLDMELNPSHLLKHLLAGVGETHVRKGGVFLEVWQIKEAKEKLTGNFWTVFENTMLKLLLDRDLNPRPLDY